MEQPVLVADRVAAARQNRCQLHPLLGEGVVRQNALVGEELDHPHVVYPAAYQAVYLASVPFDLARLALELLFGQLRAAGAEAPELPRCLLAPLDQTRSLCGRIIKHGPDPPADRGLVRSGQVCANPFRQVRSCLNALRQPGEKFRRQLVPPLADQGQPFSGKPVRRFVRQALQHLPDLSVVSFLRGF